MYFIQVSKHCPNNKCRKDLHQKIKKKQKTIYCGDVWPLLVPEPPNKVSISSNTAPTEVITASQAQMFDLNQKTFFNTKS